MRLSLLRTHVILRTTARPVQQARCPVTERGAVVTAARLDVDRAGFARAQSFGIQACDGDQRCAAVSVSASIHGLNDNAPFCDRHLIR